MSSYIISCSMVIDMVINNNRQSVQFMIFSEKWEDTANAINNDTHRGCTLIHGTGWHTKQLPYLWGAVARATEGYDRK